MKYKEYEIVKSAIENNRWDEAIEVVDDLLSKHEGDEDLITLSDEIRLWHQFGAQVRPIKSVAKDMGVSEYIYDETSDDGDHLVLYVPGDIIYPNDLVLDLYDADEVPWLEGNYSIFVNGDINVKGTVDNLCPNTGVSLCVAGGITADYLIGGGSIIAANGQSNIKYAVFGHYNDGAILLGELKAQLFWSEDHLMWFTPGNNSPHWVSDDNPEEKIEILNPIIVTEIIAELQKEFEEDNDDSNDEEFDAKDELISSSLFENYLLNYLFGDNPRSFEYVFSGLFVKVQTRSDILII